MPCRKQSMNIVHPSCIHILHWSLKRSVKRTWTGSAYSTNESAWVLVTGSQSRVWSGPKLLQHLLVRAHPLCLLLKICPSIVNCCRFILSDFEWTYLELLKLILVSNQLSKRKWVAYYFKTWCWMNETFAYNDFLSPKLATKLLMWCKLKYAVRLHR